MKPTPTTSEADRQARFHRDFLLIEQDLRAFLAMAVGQWDHVDDLCQEVAVILWRKIDSYDPRYAFGAWARGIARRVVLRYYERGQSRCIPLSAEALEALDQGFCQTEIVTTEDDRLSDLRRCLDRLGERARRYIAERYSSDQSVEEIASSTGASFEAVKKALVRARRQLADCMEAVRSGRSSS